MKPDHDKQTELQRMLALKRHEAPPPRFFRGFSDKVIDRLHTPEPPTDPTWRQRLGLDSDNKTVLVCVSAVVVCGCLAAGMVASIRVDPPKPTLRSASDQSHLIVAPSPNAMTEPAPQLKSASGQREPARIGEPMVMSEPSAFDRVQLQPVSLPAVSQTISNRAGAK